MKNLLQFVKLFDKEIAMKKAYIVLNVIDGWKLVLDSKHVDCTKPLYVDKDLDKVKEYSVKHNLEIIRICK